MFGVLQLPLCTELVIRLRPPLPMLSQSVRYLCTEYVREPSGRLDAVPHSRPPETKAASRFQGAEPHGAGPVVYGVVVKSGESMSHVI